MIPFRHRTAVLLAVIVLSATLLRLVNLDQSPPGLNQDEAANAWNAYCLLKTGTDQVGTSWPIFYMRGLGGNRTTLYAYLLLPFQALGGLNIYTTRLPAVIGGVLTVLLIYFVGKRLFDKQIGLLAATFLALNPWHIQQSRWGHEAALCALFGIAPLAMLLWANMPLLDNKNRTPRVIPAALAGALTGIFCYGYHAVRVFIAVFLVAIGLATLPGWRHSLKTRKGLFAIAAFVITFAATFGPLAFKHLTDPEGIAKRAQTTLLWSESDSPGKKIAAVLSRYAGHFGPDFLFVHGDHYELQSPPDTGQMHWYMLPLMVSGLIVLTRQVKHSYAARILLIYVIVYPIGDCFSRHISLHSLRSSPGLCSLILLAAFGTVTTIRWLWRQNRALALTIAGSLIIAVAGLNIRYLPRFYGQYNRRPTIYHRFHVDLIEACRWLRPRLSEIDAVFCTTKGMNQPYITTLIALEYDPRQWFSEERDFITPAEFDIYTRYGKMHFMYGQSFVPALAELKKKTSPDRIIFIVRPGELGLKNPIHRIRRPDGQDVLWIAHL